MGKKLPPVIGDAISRAPGEGPPLALFFIQAKEKITWKAASKGKK